MGYNTIEKKSENNKKSFEDEWAWYRWLTIDKGGYILSFKQYGTSKWIFYS